MRRDRSWSRKRFTGDGVNAIHEDSSTSDAIRSDEPGLASRFFRPRTLVSFVIGLVIVAFAISKMQVDVADSIRIIRRANWLLFGIALLVYYTVFLTRGYRWRVMLENTGLSRQQVPSMFGLGEIIYLSWFTNSILPAKLGDVYRAYLLRSRSSLSFTMAGGTIIAERILDVAVLVLLLLSTALVSFRGVVPATFVLATQVGALIIIVAIVGMIAVVRLNSDLRRIIPGRFVRFYDNIRDGTVGSFGSYPVLIGVTVLAWLGEVGRLYFVTQALGVQLSPNSVLNLIEVAFVAFAAAMLSAVPLTPGGLGFVDSGMVAALAILVPSPDQASTLHAVWLLDRSLTFGSLIVGGLIVYVASHRHPSRPILLSR
jgi:uncharacterized protein (TIRG00374 family)